MTTTHLILRYAHISMGLLALVAGAAAMALRKGSPLHRHTGTVFFGAMLIMAGTGTYISIFMTPVASNIMGGSLTLYLVITAWARVWREPGAAGYAELGAAGLGLAVAMAGIAWGIQGVLSTDGQFDGFPFPFYFIFGGIALLGTLGDGRMLLRGGVTGAQRTTRHLWRMLFAMFIATASFFVGQAKLFPEGVRESGVLGIPGWVVLGSIVYWVLRVRIVPAVKRWRVLRGRVRSSPASGHA